MSELLPAMRDEFGFGDGRAVAQFDPGHYFLTVLLARHTDDLRLAYGRQRVQAFLDLARGDVFSTADDHVFDPADDAHVPFVVHHGQVA